MGRTKQHGTSPRLFLVTTLTSSGRRAVSAHAYDISETYTDYFDADGPFKEGNENNITLPECEPAIFEAFVQWLYYGSMCYYFELDVYCGFFLWALGDRLLAPGFKKLALLDIYSTHVEDGAYIQPVELDYCWSNTTESSKLRRLVLDVISSGWTTHLETFGYPEWEILFDKYPDLRDALFQRLGQNPSVLPVKSYIDTGE